MSGLVAVNPKPFLTGLIEKTVIVRLKWGNIEYKGTLESYDDYMNFLLRDCEEWIDGTVKGALGTVFIRCNNILYIREKDPLKVENNEVKMAD
ncbi:LSM domain-containing protein [Cryptosporidium muris RN66]|uniref:Sm protein F n=1 Tax=Cryptosporidium muris (strain RN66) TaxID=441375 RepID=B6AI33_CRYMR|nr:LSM domain-containing protein [Cryptosporidium muris RN66]EEA07874.1 LSM domain-containing protein [Cryptosporidium muris RN66]|eukprot:XP_002142223.1 LSM domain-containing protein [Cryptosporidium muris RN66]